MYTLYYAPRSAAMGVRVLLEAIGAAYELSEVDIRSDEPRDPAFLRINPNGWVPALVYDGGAIYEAAAITIFLCDRHPEAGLAPPPEDPLRGKFLQWLVYMAGTLQPAYQMAYYPFRFASREEDYPSVRSRAATRLAEIWRILDDSLDPGPWLLGDRFSACDIYLHMLSTWLSDEHPAISEFPNAARCVERVAMRPEVERVFA
ncbi:MAG: glutathione S-transferase family protein [Gammaproteobacteria bacterium]|nr:MAG: glutathione S-transferase family protein [Gammaproteobacteria bacterium]